MNWKERAIQLRDAALRIVQRQGALQPVNISGLSLLTYRDGKFSIAYRTPMRQPPKKAGPSAREIERYAPYTAALLHQQSGRNLPYGLDIWCGGKVLSIEWADNGTVALISYKPGEWEGRLLTIDTG